MTSAVLPKYERVKRDLIRQIRSGRWALDEPFPSEAKLLEQFDVSRPTLVRSLQDLVREGYLYRRQGQGTFIAFGREAKPSTTTVLPVFLNTLTAGLHGEAREVCLQLLQGIQDAVADRATSTIVHQTPPNEIGDETRRFLSDLPPGPALVIEPSFNPLLVETLRDTGWRVWGVNEPMDDGPCVFIDQERAGYLATQWLLKRGRRQIALLNGPRDAYWGFAARLRGYRHALEDADVAFDPALVREGYDPMDGEAGRTMMRDLLESEVALDGVVGVSDAKAIGARSVLIEAGRRVPDDVAVIGIDDTIAGRVDPPLPAVAMPFNEVGRQAAMLALRLGEDAHDADAATAHVRLQPRIVRANL